ncbi:MAG: PaaI family thioesterase [Chloroflexota bacterium]|nr:PaaI family thioesterase [Chloroflexota bacterium]
MPADSTAGLIPHFNHSPFFQLLGLVVEEARPGYARLSCQARAELVHDGGILQGGVTATLADIAAVMGILSEEPPPAHVATVQLQINYLRPVGEGDLLLATAVILQRGKRLAFADVNVANSRSGELVAKASVTCSVGQP